MAPNSLLFLISLGFGLGVALIGGLIEYWTNLRPGATKNFRQRPSCLIFVGGGLAVAGIIAMIASAILNGTIGGALIVGAGVLVGFYSGFIILFGLWFLVDRN